MDEILTPLQGVDTDTSEAIISPHVVWDLLEPESSKTAVSVWLLSTVRQLLWLLWVYSSGQSFLTGLINSFPCKRQKLTQTWLWLLWEHEGRSTLTKICYKGFLKDFSKKYDLSYWLLYFYCTSLIMVTAEVRCQVVIVVTSMVANSPFLQS